MPTHFPDFGPAVRCEICQDSHPARYLCDAKNAHFEAMRAAADANNVPTLQFDTPIEGMIGDEGTDTVLMRQFLPMGAIVPGPTGVNYPVLIITGRDKRDQPLPRWLYVADGSDLRRTVKLVDEMANLAIREATIANRKRKR